MVWRPRPSTFVLTPTTSLAGTVQITARVLEVALHKVHALAFPLARVRDGLGAAPLPPPSPDFLTAMGRTNDAILFGGEVQLFVTGPEAEAADLAARLPSSASRDFGKPFGRIFADAGGDFYQIDPMLFSPARVMVTALDTGRTFTGGGFAPELLAQSFGDGSRLTSWSSVAGRRAGTARGFAKRSRACGAWTARLDFRAWASPSAVGQAYDFQGWPTCPLRFWSGRSRPAASRRSRCGWGCCTRSRPAV